MALKSSVTDRQIFFLLFLTLTSYTIISISKVIAQGVGPDGWVALTITSLVFAVFAAIIVRLNSAFPGMMLFDYCQRIAGKFLAYAVAIYFILYFLMVSVYLNTRLTQVLREEFYPKTPAWAMLVSGVLVFGWVAQRGVTGVARFFEIIGTVFVITAIATHIVMFQQGDLREILPFFRASKLPDYLLATKDTVTAFLGIELLTVFPLSGKNVKRTTWTAALSLVVIGLFYVLVAETSIMIVGMKSTENYEYALIEAIKQINAPVLERFDVLFLSVGFSGLVAGICGVYLALVEYAVRIFKKAPRWAVVAGVGAAIIALGIAAQAVKNSIDLFEAAIPAAGLVSAFLIPAILLLTAKVRGLVQKPQ